MPPINYSKRGFSIIEILIALGIFVVLSSGVWGAFSSFKKAVDLRSAADVVFDTLSEARSKTVSAENGERHGVHFETESVTLFQGASFIEGDTFNQKRELPPTVEISSIALSAGSDALFKKLTGETDNDGTIMLRLKSDISKTKTVVIQKTGLVIIE